METQCINVPENAADWIMRHLAVDLSQCTPTYALDIQGLTPRLSQYGPVQMKDGGWITPEQRQSEPPYESPLQAFYSSRLVRWLISNQE